MAPTLGGGTQDTDFNKGFTKGILQKIFGEEMGGVRGTQTPLSNSYCPGREVVAGFAPGFSKVVISVIRCLLVFYKV